MTNGRTFMLSLLIASAISVRGNDVVTLVGPMTRVLTGSEGDIRFPLEIASVAFVQIMDVGLDGVPVPPTGFVALLEPQGFLVIRIAEGAARDAGTYTIVVRTAPPQGTPEFLTVTLVRPAIEIRFGSGGVTRLTRTFYWPGRSVMRPQSVTINTVGRGGEVVPLQRVWTGDLRDGESATVGQVRVQVPPRMQVPGNATATIDVLGDPPLGSTAAMVRMGAPQLAGGAIEIPVELVSKLAVGWLFIVTFLGVVTGYLVRDVLEKQRVRGASFRLADQTRRDVTDLLRSTVDAGDASKLREIVATLESEISSRGSTAAAITAAAERAKTEAASVVAATNDVRETLSVRIAKWKAVFGHSDGQVSPVAAVLASSLGAIEELEQQLVAGESRSLQEALTRTEMVIRNDLNEALVTWRAEVADGLARIGAAMPISLGDNVLTEVTRKLEALASAEDIPAQVNAAMHLAAALRAGLRMICKTVVRKALKVLDSVSVSTTDAHLARARGLVQAVEQWSGEPADRPLAALLISIETLNVAVREAQERAASAEKLLGSSLDERLPAAASASETAEFASETAVPLVRIVAFGRTISGQVLSYRVVSATSQPLPRIALVEWIVGNQPIQSTMSPLFTYTPPVAQLLTVSANITFEDRSRTTAHLSLPIAPAPESSSPEAVSKQGRLAEIVQTAVAAILITIAGMLIFRSAFVGNIEDLAGAFLWGFGTDIGLARVRELTQQMTAARK